MHVYKEIATNILPTKKGAITCKSTELQRNKTYTALVNNNNVAIYRNMFQHRAHPVL